MLALSSFSQDIRPIEDLPKASPSFQEYTAPTSTPSSDPVLCATSTQRGEEDGKADKSINTWIALGAGTGCLGASTCISIPGIILISHLAKVKVPPAPVGVDPTCYASGYESATRKKRVIATALSAAVGIAVFSIGYVGLIVVSSSL